MVGGLESALLSPLLTSDTLTWGNGGLAALQPIPPLLLAASIAQRAWTCWLSLGSSSANSCLGPEDSWTTFCSAMTYLARHLNPGPKPWTWAPTLTVSAQKAYAQLTRCIICSNVAVVLGKQPQWETPSVRTYRIHCSTPIQRNILEPFIFRVDDFYMKSLSMICPHQ